MTQYVVVRRDGRRADASPDFPKTLAEFQVRIPTVSAEDACRRRLNEFVFRFSRRRTPMAAFQSLLGLTGQHGPTTYHALYRAE